jgi:hypothetical protein
MVASHATGEPGRAFPIRLLFLAQIVVYLLEPGDLTDKSRRNENVESY